MEYIECKIELATADTQQLEIFIAELADNQYESFVEESEAVLLAYIQTSEFNRNYIDLLSKKNPTVKISYKKIEDQNWNEVWEQNYFKPLIIADKCLIKSTLHKTDLKADYEILIDPKMAFGTGHHETTSSVVERMLDYDFHGKTVLDMGTGTGILAILARMLGAQSAVAIDIDIWSYQNTLDNLSLNKVDNIETLHGDKSAIPDTIFDIVIANINRNILLADVPDYIPHLKKGGQLFLSGFYTEDIPVIDEMAQKAGLEIINQSEKKNWVCLVYQKI